MYTKSVCLLFLSLGLLWNPYNFFCSHLTVFVALSIARNVLLFKISRVAFWLREAGTVEGQNVLSVVT